MDSGPSLKDMLVLAKVLSTRWVSAKPEETMFAPTVGLYNVSTQSSWMLQ